MAHPDPPFPIATPRWVDTELLPPSPSGLWDASPSSDQSPPPAAANLGGPPWGDRGTPGGQWTGHAAHGFAEPGGPRHGPEAAGPELPPGPLGLPEAIDRLAQAVAVEAVNPCVLPQHRAVPGSPDLSDRLGYKVGLRIVRTWMATAGDSRALQDVAHARQRLYADLGLDLSGARRPALVRSLTEVYGISADCLVPAVAQQPTSPDPPRPYETFPPSIPSTTVSAPPAPLASTTDDDFGRHFDHLCGPAAPAPAAPTDTLATLAQLQALRLEWQLLQQAEAEGLRALRLPVPAAPDLPDRIDVATLRRQVTLLKEKVKQLTKAAAQQTSAPAPSPPAVPFPHGPAPLTPAHFLPSQLHPSMPYAPQSSLLTPSMLLGPVPPPPPHPPPLLAASPSPPSVPLVPRAQPAGLPPTSEAVAPHHPDLDLVARGLSAPNAPHGALRYLEDPVPDSPVGGAPGSRAADGPTIVDYRYPRTMNGAAAAATVHAASVRRKPPPSYTEALQDRVSPPRPGQPLPGAPTRDAEGDSEEDDDRSASSSSSASGSQSQDSGSASAQAVPSPARGNDRHPMNSRKRRSGSRGRRSTGSTRSTLSAAPPFPLTGREDEPMKPFTRHLLPRPVVIEDDRLAAAEPPSGRRRQSSSPRPGQSPLPASWFAAAGLPPPNGLACPPLPFPLPDPFDARLPAYVAAALQGIAQRHDPGQAARLLAPPYGSGKDKQPLLDAPVPDPLSGQSKDDSESGEKYSSRKRPRRTQSPGSPRRTVGDTKPTDSVDAEVSGLTELFTTNMLQRAIAAGGVAYLRISRPAAARAEVTLADAAAYRELFRKFDGRILEGHELQVDKVTQIKARQEMDIQEEVLLTDLPAEPPRPPSPPRWPRMPSPTAGPRLSPFRIRSARPASPPPSPPRHGRHRDGDETHGGPVRRDYFDSADEAEQQRRRDRDRERRERPYDEHLHDRRHPRDPYDRRDERDRERDERDRERDERDRESDERDRGGDEQERRRPAEEPEVRKPLWTTVVRRRRPGGGGSHRR